MKTIVASLALILCISFTTANAQSPAAFTTIKHDFGAIPQGVPATYFFVLKNTGTKPLIIETATADCGCTTPEYPKEPIMAGKEAKIKVTYSAAVTGIFVKNITVKFATVTEPTILSINGEVKAAK